ncbi:hypothetical protein CAP39_06830 [Sphingomonas sp. IBVSS1]|nr:hypothetical protein CAP39_06830 [Sphingomonas sp. IBVSS1]
MTARWRGLNCPMGDCNMETWVERPHAAGHTSDPEAAAWSLQLPPETAADMAFRLPSDIGETAADHQ